MRNLYPWKRKKIAQEIDILENRLRGLLVPVRPRREFLHEVKDRLREASEAAMVSMDSRPLPNTPVWVLLLTGIASIAIFLLAGLRAAIAILGALGLLTQLNKDPAKKPRKVRVKSPV